MTWVFTAAIILIPLFVSLSTQAEYLVGSQANSATLVSREEGLSSAQAAILQEHGFVVDVDRGYASVAELYRTLATEGEPILVTSDTALRAVDAVLYSAILSIQLNVLRPALLDLTREMASAAREQWHSANSSAVQEAAQKNWAFFTVARRLMDEGAQVPEPIAAAVRDELSRIEAHSGPADSALFAYREDYRAYDVGAETAPLRGFRQAKTWYERMAFRLRPGETDQATAQGRSETLRALLATSALRQNASALARWRRVEALTAFIEGEADSRTVADYQPLIANVYGSPSSPDALAQPELLDAFMEEARQWDPPRLRPPWLALDSTLAERTDWRKWASGFSFLGRRFSPADWVMQSLSYPAVGTASRPRSLPRGLDLLAAMGSDRATTLLERMGAFSFPGYESQLAALQPLFAPEGEESRSVRHERLRRLGHLLGAPNGADTVVPGMGSDAWGRKALATSLAGWTAQSRASLPAGMDCRAESTNVADAAVAGGAVVPYPELYDGLRLFTERFQQALQTTFQIDLPSAIAQKLKDLESFLDRLASISRTELDGTDLSVEDVQWIRQIGDKLTALISIPDSLAQGLGMTCRHPRMKPVVHAAYNDYRSNQASEAATGNALRVAAQINRPNRSRAQDEHSRPAYGAVLSYYEFRLSLDGRFTQQDWQRRVSNAPLPLPGWTTAYAPQSMDSIPFETVARGTHSGVTDVLEAVVRDQSTWADFWEAHTSGMSSPPERPQIDFDRQMVLAVSAGEQPTGGHNARITRVEAIEMGLRVHYAVEQPGPGCFVSQTLTQPFHIVKLARHEGPVAFVPRYEEVSCP